MFSKSPIFLNANDVLNIADPDLNIKTVDNEKKTDIKLSLEEKIINTQVKENIEIKKQNEIKQKISNNEKYPGDDIPWIF